MLAKQVSIRTIVYIAEVNTASFEPIARSRLTLQLQANLAKFVMETPSWLLSRSHDGVSSFRPSTLNENGRHQFHKSNHVDHVGRFWL